MVNVENEDVRQSYIDVMLLVDEEWIEWEELVEFSGR